MGIELINNLYARPLRVGGEFVYQREPPLTLHLRRERRLHCRATSISLDPLCRPQIPARRSKHHLLFAFGRQLAHLPNNLTSTARRKLSVPRHCRMSITITNHRHRLPNTQRATRTATAVIHAPEPTIYALSRIVPTLSCIHRHSLTT